MRKIIIDFGVMTLFDVSVKHLEMCGEYYFDLMMDGRYIGRLDMRNYKLVKSKHFENLYTLERR